MTYRRAFPILILLAVPVLGMGAPGAYAVEEPASRWIVVYKNSAFNAQAVQRRAGKTRHSYKIIPGYAADLSATEIEQLRNDPSVASLEPDAIRHTLKTTASSIYITDGHYSTTQASGPTAPYGIDLVHARDVWPYTKGAGVRVANIDTGIDLQHPDLPPIVASTTFTNMPIQDSVGHGTHTAGTIAAPGNGTGVVGVAPQAGLLVAQVFDNAGNAHDSDIIAGIDWAIQNGAKVINMSLGGATFDAALSQTCQNAVAAGIVVVAAAGNDGTSAPSYPADYPSVLAVAAVDQSMQRASFSSFGPSVDLCAPGVGVLSTAPVGTGWLTSANWSTAEHQTSSMEGSANGTVTGSAVYCGLGNPGDFPPGVSGQIAHIRRGTLLFEDKVNNAVAAGAAGVIISNNTQDAVNGQLNGNASVVVVVVSQLNGDELQANDGLTATITNQKPADYTTLDGTSMSSPHVSGVAALLIAARHGQITPAEVTSAMQNTARDLGALGRDDLYGYGLVDALAALGNVIPVLRSLSASPALVGAGDTITVTARLSTSVGLASLTANGISLSASGGVWTGSVPAESAPGPHTIDVAVTDNWGNIHHDTSLTYTTANPQAVIVAFTSPASGVMRNCPNLDIAGTARGSLGIASVAWALNGQPGGPCIGTTNWSAEGITLAPGANPLTVTATDTLGNTGTATLTVTFTDAKPGSAWQGVAMVSLPIIPDSSDPQSQVGFTSTGWYLYDTLAGNYVAYPDQRTWFTPLNATPGRGFWAFFPASGGNTACGTIPPQNQAKTIHLQEGWNLIGQPFVNSVAWDSQAVTVIRTPGAAPAPLANCGDVVANYAWGWDAVNGSYYLVMDAAFASGAVGELSPWQAYWIEAFKDCDLVLPPP